MPLARLFCFYAAISARMGCDANGPTFVERDMLAARNAARAEHALSAHSGRAGAMVDGSSVMVDRRARRVAAPITHQPSPINPARRARA